MLNLKFCLNRRVCLRNKVYEGHPDIQYSNYGGLLSQYRSNAKIAIDLFPGTGVLGRLIPLNR